MKKEQKNVEYFETTEEQISYICDFLLKSLEDHKPETVIFEALSYASVGNATRDLAQLFGAMNELIRRKDVNIKVIHCPPNSLKAFARDFLPEEERTVPSPKDKRKRNLVKMDKKLMVRSVELIKGEDYFKGYNFSTGKDDLADSFLLGYKFFKENS